MQLYYFQCVLLKQENRNQVVILMHDGQNGSPDRLPPVLADRHIWLTNLRAMLTLKEPNTCHLSISSPA